MRNLLQDIVDEEIGDHRNNVYHERLVGALEAQVLVLDARFLVHLRGLLVDDFDDGKLNEADEQENHRPEGQTRLDLDTDIPQQRVRPTLVGLLEDDWSAGGAAPDAESVVETAHESVSGIHFY